MIYLGDKKVGAGLPSDYDKLFNAAIYKGLEKPLVSDSFKLDADTFDGQLPSHFVNIPTYESYNNLSTVEHWTGVRDIGGKKIYEKTFIGDCPGSTTTSVAHGISNINLSGHLSYKGQFGTSVTQKSNGMPYVWVRADVGQRITSIDSINSTHFYIYDNWLGSYRVYYQITYQYTCTDR